MAKDITNPFILKILQNDPQSNCLIYDDKKYLYKDLYECLRQKLEFIKFRNSVVAVIGDYDLDSIAFMLAAIETNNIIVPLIKNDKELDSKLDTGEVDFIYKNGEILEYSYFCNSKQISTVYHSNFPFTPCHSESVQPHYHSEAPSAPCHSEALAEESYKPTNNKDALLHCNSSAQHDNKIIKTKEKHQIIKTLQDSNEAGLILFSSGSTGNPKAIVHNLNTLLQAYLNKKEKRINILLFLLFDHIGGLDTLFNSLSLGACGVAFSDRKNLAVLAKTIQNYKISLLPASPSLLNLMILDNLYDKYDLSHLKIITYGTEKMPESLLIKLKEVFKNTRFHETFGTSEIGVTQTRTYNNTFKLKDCEYKIIEGELYIKSNTRSLGYLNADNSAFCDDGYFATGDLVETLNVNGEEYLKIIGRSKEVINVGGEKVLPQEVENIVMQIPYIKDCLAYGENNIITGQTVALKVVLDSSASIDKGELKRNIRIFCKDKLANFKIPTKVAIVDSLAISTRFKKIRK